MAETAVLFSTVYTQFTELSTRQNSDRFNSDGAAVYLDIITRIVGIDAYVRAAPQIKVVPQKRFHVKSYLSIVIFGYLHVVALYNVFQPFKLIHIVLLQLFYRANARKLYFSLETSPYAPEKSGILLRAVVNIARAFNQVAGKHSERLFLSLALYAAVAAGDYSVVLGNYA